MRRFLFCLALLCLPPAFLLADTLELKNGDRLTGKVKALEAGKLTFTTSYAGDVKINWDQVRSLASEEPLVVEFVTGKAFTGAVSTPQPGQIEIGTEPAPLRMDEIVAMSRRSEPLPDPGLLENWHGAADLGYTVTRGNTEVNNLSFSVAPERKTSNDRTSARLQILRSVQDGRVASGLYRGRVRYDRFLSPRTFFFGQADFEKDARELLDLRTSQGGGFGFRLRPAAETQLSIFGGVTFLQEQFEGLDRMLEAEGLGGAELETLLLKPLIFSTKAQILPILTDDRYRVEWDAAVRLPVFARFTLGFQVFDYFDSNPPRVGVQKNDFGLISTFGYTF